MDYEGEAWGFPRPGWKKGILYGLGLAFVLVLKFQAGRYLWPFFLLFALFYLAFYFYQRYRPESKSWFGEALLDLSWVGFLIYASEGLASPLVLFYPFILLDTALVCPALKNFLLVGCLGHVTYTLSLYFFYGTSHFYFTLPFWVLCTLIGLFFSDAFQIACLLDKAWQKTQGLRKELEERNKKLEALAITDELTNLYNHRYFYQRLREELERAKRYRRPLTLLMLDVDDFKHFNDHHGHLEGDRLLRELSRVLLREIREADIPCRYGGEEFNIILPETNLEQGQALAERLRQKVAQTHFTGEEVLPGRKLTVSIGLAAYPENALEAVELVGCADSALYQAKQKKDCVQVYAGETLFEDRKPLANTLEDFIRVIDARDKYTWGHSERVAGYVVSLAKRLGFSVSETSALGYAAFLHDLGKVKISAEILNKPGPLSPKEWREIQKHPVWSVEIINDFLNHPLFLATIRYHHERWDGKGYPEGLKEEEIPLGARLLALAEAFDTMTTENPYRKALPKEEALTEINREAGKQFDPKLVPVFRELIAVY